ncbi:MAG: hypothetical protein V7784_16020 [Oceanospirillaceae bacterium]
MENKKLLRTLLYTGIGCISLSAAITIAAPSFQGPSSVPQFHPLCLSILKDWSQDGGALDMQQCALTQSDVEVIKTPDGAYYAKRVNGEAGFMAYKPIGSLDESMELLLVYDKKNGNPITSIHFLGRIPGSALNRAFLTTIEKGGDRCLGGVSAARLISPSELEVDVNATVHQMLTFLTDSGSRDATSLSLKPNNYEAYACAGTITKTYNLISNKMNFSKVTFTRDESRKVIDKSSRCYDKVVAEQLSAPRVLDMAQYQDFLETYKQHCGNIR